MKPKDVLNNLNNLYHEQKLAHAYLFETNNIDNCYRDLLNLIKQILCPNKYSENCSSCNICHLIDINNLPSLITIEPENGTIKKEQIESIKYIFSKKAVYTKENIYIIKSAENMNATAYNRLLKFLEEPEQNIIAFFIAEQKDKMASTIVSRCETIIIIYDEPSKDVDQKINDLAKEFIKNLNVGEKKAIWYNNSVLQKELTNRSEVITFLNILLNIYRKENNFIKVKVLAKYLEMLDYNVNLSLVMDSLIIEMGQCNEK